MADSDPLASRPRWLRLLWGTVGALALTLGVVGIFVPLLPTTPFVILAAFCWSRASARAEQWLLGHPRLGPLVRDWRSDRAVPLRAKQFAWASMAVSSLWAWWVMPPGWRWVPAGVCLLVAAWLAVLPTRLATPPAKD